MADYSSLTKDQLVEILQQRDRRPQFGLLWERDEIEHDKSLNDDFVALAFQEELSLGNQPYGNMLIEGDNFDALRYLRMTHAGKVKCIYIDPPYNTGKKDFIYNDQYVDKDDLFKHSKWLEYMYRRLTLAADLLSEDGVIFVSIGETEYGHLSVLMDQVFKGMKVTTFVWRRRSGSNDAKEWFVSLDHEYVLCYANPGFSFQGTPKDAEAYTNPDNDSRGPWNNDNLVQGKTFKQRPEAFYPVHNTKTELWYPCDPDNVWRFASESRLESNKKIRTKPLEQLIREERILWPDNDRHVTYRTEAELLRAISDGSAPHNLRVYLSLEEVKRQVEAGAVPRKLLENIPPLTFWVGKKIGYGKPRYKRFWSELRKSEKPISTWLMPAANDKDDLAEMQVEWDEVQTMSVGYTSEGTSLIQKMLGHKDFQYPKPMSLITSLIRQATRSNQNDIVLDFFAGSGTTGHAVLEANGEDGGDRRFILVSSTEATVSEPEKNVCRNITRPRLTKAIEGYSYRTAKGIQEVPGLGGEFAYFTIRKLPVERITNRIEHKEVWIAVQMLENQALNMYDYDQDFQINEDGGSIVVYASQVTPALIEWLSHEFERNVVVYSWQPGILKQHVTNPAISFGHIPKDLLKRFGF